MIGKTQQDKKAAGAIEKKRGNEYRNVKIS